MTRIARTLILAALVASTLLAAKPAAACTPHSDMFSGSYYYVWSDPPRGPVQCGSSNTVSCFRVLVTNKACNDLQSWGTVIGSINWFGNSSPVYSFVSSPAGSPRWTWPNETGVVYWYDSSLSATWNKAACTTQDGYNWNCAHKQLGADGQWYGTATLTLHHIN